MKVNITATSQNQLEDLIYAETNPYPDPVRD
jgi:hypothetical protein